VARDSKYLGKVLIMFLPIPAFRAAFDQQGSRWTLQAVRMNGYVGDIHFLPEQAQIISPFFDPCFHSNF